MALSVERVRSEMLRGLLIPRDIVNEALKVTYNKLKATETKFFSNKGVVRDMKVVEDHATQLAAADQIYSLSGLYARERVPVQQTPGVALEVDPLTGVIRIVIGTSLQSALPTVEMPTLSEPSAVGETTKETFPLPAEEVVTTHRRRKIPIPDAVWKIIDLGEDE